MEQNYLEKVIAAAESKLEKAEKPLSEGLLIPGIITILKSQLKNDDRHTSKVRFKKDTFSVVTKTTQWKSKILTLPNGNYFLKKDEEKFAERPKEINYNWENVGYLEAVDYSLKLLKKIDPFELESLVGSVLEKSYKGYKFQTTQRTGDGGIDVVGIREDAKTPDFNEIVFVQVKRFDGPVSRDYADKFVGASIIKLEELRKTSNKMVSKFEGLFVSTGSYTSTFENALRIASKVGVNYYAWDGERFAGRMIKHGVGVKYSIDKDFWDQIDSKQTLKVKGESVSKTKAKSKTKKDLPTKRKKK